MDSSTSHLPENLIVAHQMIVELLQALQEKDRDCERLRHQLERLKQRLYGRKSEKISDEQFLFEYAGLLAEAKEAVSEEPDPVPVESEPECVSKPRKRNGKVRCQTAGDLRVERIEYPLEEDRCVCEKCGERLERFGEEVTRQVDYIPASFYIREQVRFKYGCPCCRETVVVSDLPSQPIEKGLPGPGLLAYLLTSKYADHLPLYRLEQIVSRQGVTISRKTMCDWVRACAKLLEPLYGRMKQEALESKVLHTDDTPVPVQNKNREGMRQGRLWVYVGDGDHPQVLYDYTPTRCREGPLKFLKDYRGYLQADAYAGYDELYRRGEVVEVGCWAHARRKYWESRKSDRKRAHTALAYVGRLYKVEREAKAHEEENKLSGKERAVYRCAARQEKSRPILEEFQTWLQEQENQVLPKSPLGEAIGYTLRQWDALTRYTNDGDLSIDNNPAEQQMRPVALGRKNWLFAGSDDGGWRAAIIYSLIQTCKRHGVDPFAYLRDVLARIADHPMNRIQELAPLAWKQLQQQVHSLPETAKV